MQGKEPVNVKKAFSCIAIIQLFALVGRNSWHWKEVCWSKGTDRLLQSVTSICLAEEEKKTVLQTCTLAKDIYFLQIVIETFFKNII